MLPTPDMLSTFCKPAFALASAGAIWIAETVTPQIPGVPEWLTALGLPVAFLVAVIYALISTNRALRDSERGRREDNERFHAKLEGVVEKGNESRDRLIRATDQQTTEFKLLADELRKRPCQLPR